MKKILCLILTVAIVFTTVDIAYAKKHDHNKNNKKQEQYERREQAKNKRQEFKLKNSPVIKYGDYKLPITPITKGMGAKVTYDQKTTVLMISKDKIEIKINFKEKTVYINGVIDNNSGIFSAKKGKGMVVLIKYIARIFGLYCDIDDDDIIIEVPELDLPTNISVTPVGGVIIANTLNSTTLYLNASAKITPGKATGGKAELYVGNTKVATDSTITDTDTQVTFTTSDNTPTNAELQAMIPKGGAVTVRLYNKENKVVVSKEAPTLTVDYVVPTIMGITSATYLAGKNLLQLNVLGASAVGDKIDVTKLVITDSAYGKSYQLTNNSSGVVKSANLIEVSLGTTDQWGLTGFNNTSTYLTLSTGSLLKDAAGNEAPGFTSAITVPLTVATTLSAPTNIVITPVGNTVVKNTLNTSTIYMDATASIIAGQATGGKAELYVGNKLIAIDNTIGATDTTVTFTTSDGTPTNSELQQIIPTGGVVTVKLYNAYNNSVVSASGNPTLNVDYIAPTIASITSVIYNVPSNQLYLIVTGAGAEGDKIDVTKLTLYDAKLGKSYQLTNSTTTGSSGTVISSTSILVNLGTVDRINLAGFGTSSVYLTIASGALLSDAAGNASLNFTSSQSVEVTVIK